MINVYNCDFSLVCGGLDNHGYIDVIVAYGVSDEYTAYQSLSVCSIIYYKLCICKLIRIDSLQL